jgi:peroxiredoxin
MKKVLFSLLLLVSFSACAFAMGGAAVQDTKYSFTLNDINGNPVNLDSYRGKKAVLLTFFTTWCPACQDEMPLIQLMNEKYASKGLEIIGIGIKESNESLTAFIRANKLSFKVLQDKKGKVATDFKVTRIPAMFIFDKTGKLQFKALIMTMDTLEKEIQKVLQ